MGDNSLSATLVAFTKVTTSFVPGYFQNIVGLPLYFVNPSGFVVYYITPDEMFLVRNEEGNVVTRNPRDFNCIITGSGNIIPSDTVRVNPAVFNNTSPLFAYHPDSDNRKVFLFNGNIIYVYNNILYYCKRNDKSELFCIGLDGRVETRYVACSHSYYEAEFPDLFDGYDSFNVLETIRIPHEYKYLSDYFSDSVEIFERMDDKPAYSVINRTENYIHRGIFPYKNCSVHGCAMIISAQTGMGKNHFVTHELFQHAALNGKTILYISNRVALNYQQKKVLHDLVNPGIQDLYFDEKDDWEKQSKFGCITLTSYHKLAEKLKSDVSNWAKEFDYVVLDECHFFYSDALFNPYTGFLLEQIPRVFQSACRIYMSATPTQVVTPICYYEELENDRINIYHYVFKRDYSRYNILFFDRLLDINNKSENKNSIDISLAEHIYTALQKKKTQKWLIFVTGIEIGNRLKKELEGKSINVAFVNSKTRNRQRREDTASNADFEAWRTILETGAFKEQVLISTSVLDNGFSIKDKSLKNIVICTHDQTEMLQQLGRCRLEDGQSVNLFLKNMNPQEIGLLFNHTTNMLAWIRMFDGSNEYPYDTLGRDAQPEKTIIRLWNRGEKEIQQLFRIEPTNGTFSFFLNPMAKWKLRTQREFYSWIKNRIETVSSYIELTKTIKSKWLNSPYLDDDYYALPVPSFSTEARKLRTFLEDYHKSQIVLVEKSKEFQEFAMNFVKLYHAACPSDTSVNISRAKNVGGKFIKTHISKLWPDDFSFSEIKANTWSVINPSKSSTSDNELSENLTALTDEQIQKKENDCTDIQ